VCVWKGKRKERDGIAHVSILHHRNIYGRRMSVRVCCLSVSLCTRVRISVLFVFPKT